MKPPRCRLCNTEHWNTEPHKFASNAASNTASNRTNSASNAGTVGRSSPVRDEAASVALLPAERSPANERELDVGRKQRWDREKYNAYQREYMARKRAERK